MNRFLYHLRWTVGRCRFNPVTKKLHCYIHNPRFYFDGKGINAVAVVIQALARLERKRTLMKRTGHFGFVALAANHAPPEGHLLAVWTFVIRRVPLAPARKIKNGDLPSVDQSAGATVFGNIVNPAGCVPGWSMSGYG